MIEETWLPVCGYGDCYSVSNLGRVMRTSPRAIRRLDVGSRAKPFAPSECRSFINRDGYPQVRIGPTGAQKTVCVHRLVAAAFIANPGGVRCVNHINGIKTDNSVVNLEWVTHQQNTRHAMAIGLLVHPEGCAHHSAKFSESQVLSIRADGRNAMEIAKAYGVSDTAIKKIKQRHTYRNI